MARVEEITNSSLNSLSGVTTPAGSPTSGTNIIQTVNAVVGNPTQNGTQETPAIFLTNNSLNFTYNKNSTNGLTITFTKNTLVSKIKVFTPTEDIIYGSITNNIVIPQRVFDKFGTFKLFLFPYNDALDGNLIEISVNCIDEVNVQVPDIQNIEYPSVLRGADFVGYDVDFDIKWESTNTDYIKLFVGNDTTTFIQLSPSGTQKLNVKELLDTRQELIKNEDSVDIPLTLVPINSSTNEVVEGRLETIKVQFEKGRLDIPRSTAINRIAEGFINQFDESVFSESSKYLTHLLHFGNGDNKVITTWVGSESSLILKLYEPLPTSVQPNQLVWISKIQSNPVFETITIVGDLSEYCPPLRGPNFTIEPNNGIGFQIYDDIVASGSTTSNDLLNSFISANNIDTRNLDIQYVSGSEYTFENFVNFGSAEERVENFVYKLERIETYQEKYNELTSGSSWTGSIAVKNNTNSLFDKINEIKRGFDGFENFLYTQTASLTYPKVNNESVLTTTSEAESWFLYIKNVASEYDKYNPNYLVNNLPEFIKEDSSNEEFLLFLDMVGQHYDTIWSYVKGMGKLRILEEKQMKGMANNMVYHMLKSFGWNAKKSFESEYLWDYVLGKQKDGTEKYGKPLKDANDEIWRRILNNLPYLLKNKGTKRSVQAIMACYGVPQSMLTIMEFGGPQDPVRGGVSKFTFDDFTSAIKVRSGNHISVPWKEIPTLGHYPNAVELRFKPDELNNTTTIVSIGQFDLKIVPTSASKGVVSFGLNDLTTQGNYFNEPFISESVPPVSTTYFDYTTGLYVLPPEGAVSGSDFVISKEYWTNILINRELLNTGGARYDIYLQTATEDRIISEVSSSLISSETPWGTGSLTIGGNFSGSIDEFRLWRVPLEKSKYQNHTLFPDAINGNSYTASTADLMFRLDFEYPKDRVLDQLIKNVAISTLYGETNATASGFYSAPLYPYQYTSYERTVTANIPSTGYSLGNKVRFEEQELVTDLSYKQRATKKSFDQAPIDSNRLGIFFSPIKELNMDIIKSFGDFNIDNYIGNPMDEYSDEYRELKTIRNYYFERLDRNINEYIRLVKYIDKSLFDAIEDLTPARSKISKGLLIEPHYLERSKTRWDKPTSETGHHATSVDVNNNVEITLKNIWQEVNLDTSQNVVITHEFNSVEGIVENEDFSQLDASVDDINGVVTAEETINLVGNYPTYHTEIEVPNGEKLTGEVDSLVFQQVGMDPNSLSNAGFGLYAENKTGIVPKYDIFGNYTSSRQNIFLVKKQKTVNVWTQTEGYPTTTTPGQQVKYEFVPTTSYVYKVTTLPFDDTISVSGDIVEVTPLRGYFPTHYRFVNNLTEGFQQSYFKGSKQTLSTTPDGLSPVESFTTNPNILRVSAAGRGSGEPILEVE